MERPSDKLDITFKGQQKTVFMDFLRLNSCLRVVGDPKNVPFMLVDPDLSENIIRVLVAEKSGPGEMFNVELEGGDLTTDDYDKLVLWAQDHITDFFKRRLRQAQETLAKLGPTTNDQLSSAAG